MQAVDVTLDGDEKYMARALYLARKGVYSTHPNPMVGCVIVKQGAVVGEGWHQYAGGDHAEVVALNQATGDLTRATMYVTLEPCNQYGRTPPCTEAIINNKIARVVVATEDPNLTTSGAGIDELRRAGIDVVVGVAEQEALEMNRAFFKYATKKLPWVTLKVASSLDGKTAMVNGESQWITGSAARLDAQKLRASHGAIMTGIGTVLRDDPQMNVRLPDVARQPSRVILDSNLSVSPTARVLVSEGDVIIFTSKAGSEIQSDVALLSDENRHNVSVISCANKGGGIDLRQALNILADKQINSVLIEAGSHLSGNILRQNLVDEIILYMSPDVMGSNTRELFSIDSINTLKDKIQLRYKEVVRIADDLRITLSVTNANG